MTSQVGFHELELNMQSARIFTVYTYRSPNVSKIIFVLPSRTPRSTPPGRYSSTTGRYSNEKRLQIRVPLINLRKTHLPINPPFMESRIYHRVHNKLPFAPALNSTIPVHGIIHTSSKYLLISLSNWLLELQKNPFSFYCPNVSSSNTKALSGKCNKRALKHTFYKRPWGV